MMTVIFDIDDVLIPWAKPTHDACVKAGLTDKPSWSTWNMAQDYGVPTEAWLDVVNSLAVPGGIYHAPPYPGTSEAMWSLLESGHDIHLVTARGFFANAETIRKWTEEWTLEYAIPGRLWFSQNKGEVARKIGATHGVDDRYENVLSLMNAGVDTYLLNQPHNQDVDFDPYRRVDTAVDFVQKILQESRQYA